jgi:hypothetical protein
MLIFDKDTLAHNTNPTPLSPLNGIRPGSFNVHHTVPTSDGNHVFIEDEFINTSGQDKIKLYTEGAKRLGEFARRLQNWAEAGQWEALSHYAARLEQQVQDFDLDRFPKTLAEFSELVGKLADEG